jgi:hypothetical protein
MKMPTPDGSFEEVPDSEGPTAVKQESTTAKLGGMLSGRRLDKKRLAIIIFIFIALIVTVVSVTKFGVTSFIVKEGESNELPPCTNECTFEGKACENGEILECVIGQDGCKHKNLVESCPEGNICSTLKEGTCYTPKACDFTFHTCITTTSYQLCKNGKTIEGAETKKCPEKLVCNKRSKTFALCVEK